MGLIPQGRMGNCGYLTVINVPDGNYLQLTEEERLSEEVPLIHINSGQYASKQLDRDYQLKQFCEEYCLDCHVPNVFVKIGRVDLSKPDAKVIDVMLMNKVI